MLNYQRVYYNAISGFEDQHVAGRPSWKDEIPWISQHIPTVSSTYFNMQPQNLIWTMFLLIEYDHFGGQSYKIGWRMSFSMKRSGMMPVAAHARNSSGSFPRLSEKDSFKEMLDGGVIGIFVLPYYLE